MMPVTGVKVRRPVLPNTMPCGKQNELETTETIARISKLKCPSTCQGGTDLVSNARFATIEFRAQYCD